VGLPNGLLNGLHGLHCRALVPGLVALAWGQVQRILRQKPTPGHMKRGRAFEPLTCVASPSALKQPMSSVPSSALHHQSSFEHLERAWRAARRKNLKCLRRQLSSSSAAPAAEIRSAVQLEERTGQCEACSNGQHCMAIAKEEAMHTPAKSRTRCWSSLMSGASLCRNIIQLSNEIMRNYSVMM
jgi:hypothetical protein